MISGRVVKVVKRIEVEVPGLGDLIKGERKRSQKNATDLASAAGMSVQNWYRIEKEKQELSVDTLRLIEKALGVDFGVKFEAQEDA